MGASTTRPVYLQHGNNPLFYLNIGIIHTKGLYLLNSMTVQQEEFPEEEQTKAASGYIPIAKDCRWCLIFICVLYLYFLAAKNYLYAQ